MPKRESEVKEAAIKEVPQFVFDHGNTSPLPQDPARLACF
jgi:hypothetical protein